PISC
ncbi:hypothetical protein AB1N83_005039, partial [Pleurotus pulmonarius]